MVTRSIATVSLSGTLDEKLRVIAAANFDAVEIFENDLVAFDERPREVAARCRDLGLSIAAYQPFRDFEGMPEPQRARNFVRAERKFDLMAELGTDLLLVCSNVSPLALGGIDRAAADFRELGERANARGLRVGFEALAWGKHVSDYRDAWEIVRRADHPNIGIILDSFHILAPGFPTSAIRSIPGDRIFLVQLADAPQLELDVLSWSRHHRSFPGQGDLPVGDFMDALAATGYRGPLSLEIFNDEFRAGLATTVAVDGYRSLALLEDAHALASSQKLPPRTATRGVGFIEFAVDQAHGRELTHLLSQLGFELTGKHRSKTVEHWAQGDIDLVVNYEQTGFAHSHYITHGSGVCAIAVKVDDLDQVMSRADELKAPLFRQPVGPGEMEIPSVRGVGGSLLYFVKGDGENWSRDFEPIAADRKQDSLVTVDHISQSMPHGDMLSWALFYGGVLDLKRLPQQEVADPVGLVQSRAFINTDESVRIVLNGSSAARTASARFISEHLGSGVQHIAFTSNDIFATVGRIRARGAALLDIPDNYYDDLEARYDLAPDIARALRDNHILYDRDAAGEFFQAYTRVFDDRFFFEIVQRKNYSGFGAPNAPVRLAAQYREARPAALLRI
jgi:4-hydroxyphenylpyruvate dioxygenase